MLQNLWKSALLCGVAICANSLGGSQSAIGKEKTDSILKAASGYTLTQHHGGGGGGHMGSGGGHIGGGHMGGGFGGGHISSGHVGGMTHNGGAIHSGGMMHSGGAIHNGGIYHSGGVVHNGNVIHSGGINHNGGIVHNGTINHSGGINHNGGIVHNGTINHNGGPYHSGVNANRAPVGSHNGTIGTHHGNGTGIQMSHGNVNLGYRGNTVSNAGIHHANIGNHPFTGNNFSLNNHHHVNLGSNSYQPSFYNHNRYHGYWNGNYGHNGVGSYRHAGYNGGYGYGPYYSMYGNGYGWGLGYSYGSGYGYRRYGYGYGGYYPFGWGLGGWGLGSIYYSSGYLGYSNPYYYGYGATCYNYAQPIPVAYNTSTTVIQNPPVTVVQGAPSASVQATSNSAEQMMNSAVGAFQQNNLDVALDTVDKGITQYPTDAVLHEFRALVLFAKTDYQQAAATIHSVLAVGPGWDWTTMAGMYSNNVALYTDQLRALETFTKSHPEDAAGHFLLSYHYLTCGHTDAAARHLQTTVTLMPSDKVAADILRMIQPPDAKGDDPENPPALPPLPVDGAENPDTKTFKPEVAPIDAKLLIGTFKASRPDGSNFVLTITDDAKFTWSFAQKGQAPQEFGGTFTVEGNVLALERNDGGALVAEITPGEDGKFNFRMLGADESDKGLDFAK